jgi:hypothetical protein
MARTAAASGSERPCPCPPHRRVEPWRPVAYPRGADGDESAIGVDLVLTLLDSANAVSNAQGDGPPVHQGRGVSLAALRLSRSKSL